MKVGLFIHVHYLDVLAEITAMVGGDRFDGVYVTTDLEVGSLRKYLLKYRNVEVKSVPNNGRDMGPFVISMAPRMKEYDLCLFLHTKKSVYREPSFGRGWCKHLVKNLAGNDSVIKMHIEMFEKNVKLGMLFPDKYPQIKHKISWGSNRRIADEFCARMGIDVYSDPEGNPPPHSCGTMFWFRPSALDRLWKLGLKWEDFSGISIKELDGTLAHTMERVFPIIVDRSNYDVVVSTPFGVK